MRFHADFKRLAIGSGCEGAGGMSGCTTHSVNGILGSSRANGAEEMKPAPKGRRNTSRAKNLSSTLGLSPES